MREANHNPPISLAAVNSVASTYLIMDYGSYRINVPYIQSITSTGWGWLPGSGPLGVTGAYASNPPSDLASGRHFNGVNVIFADGHVKWLKSEAVYREAGKCTGCQYNYTTTPSSDSAWNPYAS